MLIDIEIKNLKSFKDETVFSMEADDKYLEDKNVFEVEIGNEKLKLLKSSVLFGANASGKSNFISILGIFRGYLFNTGKEKYDKENFRFESEDKSSIIKMRNIIENKIYEYMFEINLKKKVSRRKIIYNR